MGKEKETAQGDSLLVSRIERRDELRRHRGGRPDGSIIQVGQMFSDRMAGIGRGLPQHPLVSTDSKTPHRTIPSNIYEDAPRCSQSPL
jgi:hypothetical protein